MRRTIEALQNKDILSLLNVAKKQLKILSKKIKGSPLNKIFACAFIFINRSQNLKGPQVERYKNRSFVRTHLQILICKKYPNIF